jgi:hypothetical protein
MMMKKDGWWRHEKAYWMINWGEGIGNYGVVQEKRRKTNKRRS